MGASLEPLRDRDYFETMEGWIFQVLGDIHPEGRTWSCLKYVPGEGEWGDGERRFVRVFREYSVSELLRLIGFLEERQPSYVFLDPTVNARVIAPPVDRIVRTFSARRRLGELVEAGAGGVLERKLVSLVEYLSERSGVPVTYFGVTGSILVGIQHERSDIDLVVYGMENVWRVLETMQELRREGAFTLLADAPQAWLSRASARYPLAHQDLRRLASNIFNKGRFDGVYFSIHGVRDKPAHRYGEVTYSRIGLVKSRARIVDASESLFTPAVYYVEDAGAGFDRIVCYDMMFAGVLREGDLVEVYGKMEAALRGCREEWRQVLVGSYEGVGREYIKIL